MGILISTDLLLYYHPGGNWGDMYGYVHQARLEMLKYVGSTQKVKMIGGPQTMFYYNDTIMQTEADFINRYGTQSKVILSWRQDDSYQKAQVLYRNGSTSLKSSDMAFFLGHLQPCRENDYDIVVQLRNDEESIIGNHGNSSGMSMKLCAEIEAKGYSCKVIQWITPSLTTIRRGNDMSLFLMTCTQQAVGVLSLGRVVITDR